MGYYNCTILMSAYELLSSILVFPHCSLLFGRTVHCHVCLRTGTSRYGRLVVVRTTIMGTLSLRSGIILFRCKTRPIKLFSNGPEQYITFWF